MRTRSGVVLIDRDRLWLIQRIRGGRADYLLPGRGVERGGLIQRSRDGRTYGLLPGGGAEPGATPEDAAVREAYEELGVHVVGDRLVADLTYRGRRQLYYRARIVGGRFGTGNGEEMSSTADSERGSYTPVWMTLEWAVLRADVRPRAPWRPLTQ